MAVQLLKLGRFDQSFVVRMITDFFLVLVLVVIAELGVRFGLVLYDFHTAEKQDTQEAAQGLATDVRRIMMNRGGPVAARTVYPIIEENYDRMGLQIAVTPTEVTMQSIAEQFGFRPEGIPAKWPTGTHHAVSVPVKADEFCLQCHIEASVGDTLGQVTVRNYLSTHLAQWWREVRLTGLMSLLKILLHTFVLFFLLRLRMQPLLTLRAVVSELAKGGSKLSQRAPVNSTDEFGELAADLNHFLDRIADIIDDLTVVLDRVSDLNQRLEAIQQRLDDTAKHMEDRVGALHAETAEDVAADPLLTAEWRDSVEALRGVLSAFARDHDKAGSLEQRFDDVLERLEQAADRGERLRAIQDRRRSALDGLAADFQSFHRTAGEMRALEDKMETIAESGRTLVARLRSSGEHEPS